MIFVVFLWEGGVSRASKRAKERQKRSSDELVMAETKFQPSQCQGQPDIREQVRMIRASQTARDFLSVTNFWAEMEDFRGKIEEISCMEGGETWGDARSTRNQANPWIKINKTSSYQQITKKIGAIFGGDLRIQDEIKQKKARKRGVGAPNS